MVTFDRKPRPSTAHSPAPKPASQRPVEAPPVNPLWFQLATSTNTRAAASPEVTEERRRYFEPILPAASRVPWSRIGRAASGADVEGGTSPPVAPGPQVDFARIPLMPPPIQRKATVSAPGDPYEREADEVAYEVMRMAAPVPIDPAPTGVQRNSAACGDQQKTMIRREHVPSVHAGAGLDTGAAVSAAEHGGEPLANALRSYFEPRFGHDFSRVRVHTDSLAAEAARTVEARAYTIGDNIVFGPGEYAPATAAGKRLLAHELTHVVQQSSAYPGATRPQIQRSEATPGDQQPSTHGLDVRAPDTSTFIHFPTSGAALDEDDLKVMDRLVAEAGTLSDRSELDFQIEGYADERPVAGDPKGNQTLSESRAVSTQAALQEKFNALPDGLPKKALLRSQLTHKGVGVASGGVSHQLQRRAEVKIVVKPTLFGQSLISRVPGQPEMLSVTGVGVTTKKIAIELYGDDTLASNMTVRSPSSTVPGSFGADAELPKDATVQIQYPALRPRLKSGYDASTSITTRSEWGARAPITNDPKRSYEPYTGKLEDTLDSIAVHHSGNSNLHTMKEVQDEHLDEKERADISYHFGIDRQGKIYEGRAINVKGAHIAGANTGKIGIVLLADLDTKDTGMTFPDINGDDTLTAAMEASLLQLIHYLRGKYPKIKQIGGHTEFAAVQGDERGCPGDLTMAKMNSWRSSLGMIPPVKTP